MSSDLQGLIQSFFLKRLMNQKQASPCTIASYRDTFRIFLKYMRDEKCVAPSCLTIAMLEAPVIVDFLNYLQKNRGNSAKTINQRLAAIHSFFDYVSYEQPEYIAAAKRVLGVPFRNTEKRVVNYFTEDDMASLLSSCNTSTRHGRRDRMIILLLYNTGIRVSELTGLRWRDVVLPLNRAGHIRVLGKGRKERAVPLWRTTQENLLEYFSEQGCQADDYVFPSERGGPMTRSGVRYRLNMVLAKAANAYPALADKRISPHIFRHTTAMHLLQAGVDLSTIALWLGHESLNTTHQYMEADLRLKERALAKTSEPSGFGFRYQPSGDILSFLDSL